MPRVVHFEIQATDPVAAAKFYSTIFGWTITKWEGPFDYWLVSTGETGPGIDGGIVRREGAPPVTPTALNAYICTIGVESLSDTMAAVLSNGGTIAVPQMDIPGVGQLVYFRDLDGNQFGALQPA